MDPIESVTQVLGAPYHELLKIDPRRPSVIQVLAEHDLLFIRSSQESFAGIVIEDANYNTRICLTQDHVALLIQELAHMAQLNIGPLSYKARAGGITGTPPAIKLNIDLHV